ncbi:MULTISPECIES: BglG family transcription antiterminator [Terrabacteria group]|uniref:BglG family transcription antiterminator n=1 Tax=Bacillati TaxID=1783272 RepID=UPI001C6EEBBD|nr:MULTISPECIES: BglG family transcription antiterminator [Terrabacteria group]MBW9213128.1 BglG family transcription antiterminator [Trueperella sp. zg.1013]
MDREILQLLQLIIKRSQSTLLDAERESQATRRQILYRLDKLNVLIEESQHETIKIGQDKEFIVDLATRDFLIKSLFSSTGDKTYYLNKNERKIFLFLCVFVSNEYLSSNHFTDYLNISKSTIFQDLSELSFDLEKEHIRLDYNRVDGYFLTGNEMDIRRYMMMTVISLISQETTHQVLDMVIEKLHLYTFEFSKLIIQELSEKHRISFVEDRLKEFIYIFIFVTHRIIAHSHQQIVDDLPKVEMMPTFKEYDFVDDLVNFFPFRMKMKKQDREYLSSWILGISFGNVLDDTEDCLLIAKLVSKIMTRFEILSGIHYDNIEDKFKHLYAHFRPAYYRLLFKLPIYNPLKDKVKEQYPALFNLVRETMKPMSNLFNQDINDDELTYLTMHFASIFIDEPSKEIIKKKRALIVCLNGIGSSVILHNELKLLFPSIEFLKPIEVSQFDPNRFDVDIIFTTSIFKEIAESSIPVVKVNPIMDDDEKFIVLKEVKAHLGNLHNTMVVADDILSILRNHLGNISEENRLVSDLVGLFYSTNSKETTETQPKRLVDILSKQFIMTQVECSSDLEAVKLSLLPLMKNKMITKNYQNSVVRLQKQSPSYFAITPHIALPHTKSSEGALENGISIVTLKTPLNFGESPNNPIKYLFGLSAVDNESHMKAMSDLLILLNDKDFLKLLDQETNSNKIMNYIVNYDWR